MIAWLKEMAGQIKEERAAHRSYKAARKQLIRELDGMIHTEAKRILDDGDFDNPNRTITTN